MRPVRAIYAVPTLIICPEEPAVPRTIMLLVLTALLALALLPAAVASAASSDGIFLGCYGIKKKGNYNRVRAGVHGDVVRHDVAADATLAVTRSCQRVNSIPVIEMHIYGAVLRTKHGAVLSSPGGVS